MFQGPIGQEEVLPSSPASGPAAASNATSTPSPNTASDLSGGVQEVLPSSSPASAASIARVSSSMRLAM